MIVGIDASSIRHGGGLTHLSHLLAEAQPGAHRIGRIRVWAPRATLDRLPERPWLDPVHVPALDRALPFRVAWQRSALPRLAKDCDLLFVPGGTTPNAAVPVVTMSQNLLPFEPRERHRYGASPTGARLALLRLTQASALRRAAGVIFLTSFAERRVLESVPVPGLRRVIPHGVNDRFRRDPRAQEPLSAFSAARPFRLTYVSIVDLYKHQWHVATAVAALRRAGLPLELTFVGPAYPPALRRLRRVISAEDPDGKFLHYRGPMSHDELPSAYAQADAFVFASSCETFGIIVLEAMAGGLPIACSDRSAMPELLADNAVYFDPESPSSIAAALRRLAEDPGLRARTAERAAAESRRYTWSRCADETLAFLAEVKASATA